MIFEDDKVTIKSKRQAAEHIIGRYGDLGWTLEERADDKIYENIVHLTFTRPHFIENRDELQLLQVRLDIAYNAMGRYSAKIPARASLLGSILGLLAMGFISGGVLVIVLLGGLLTVISGALMCAAGVGSGILSVVLSARIHKKDRAKYSALIEDEVKKIDGLCSTARALRGEHE